jgi:hypothetical protein
MTEDKVHIHLKEDNKPSYNELVEALELMALQYLEYPVGVLDHHCMAAGEHCLDCLNRVGLVEGSGRRQSFTKDSKFYRGE